MSRQAAKTKITSAVSLAEWVAEESLLFSDEAPFSAYVASDDPQLVVVTGENASGKSLYVQVAAARCHSADVLPVSVSIRERSGAGTNEFGGMRRIMMFGDEQEESTGAVSVKVVHNAFGNLDRPNGSVLILDEPEMGLAESYSRALGEFIGQQALSIPVKCRGVIVVTHSRALVRGLLDGYGKTPTHVSVAADEPATANLDAWLDTVEHRTVEDLLALRQAGLDRWRRVNKLIDPR